MQYQGLIKDRSKVDQGNINGSTNTQAALRAADFQNKRKRNPMKDNAHLYWPSTANYPAKSCHRLSKMWPARPRVLPAAVESIEQLDGGCVLYRLCPPAAIA